MRTEPVKCIWCLREVAVDEQCPPEHIVPEALGCPPDLVLRDCEVCSSCNHLFGSTLDGTLAEQFDFLRMLAGIRGKKKKTNTPGSNWLRSRSNAKSRLAKDGQLNIFLNSESEKVYDPEVGYIYAARGTERDVRDISVRREGNEAHVSWKVSLGGHPDFARTIGKVAFEFLAKECGRDYVLKPQFSAIRDFVLQNLGEREVISAPVVPENQSVAQGIVLKIYFTPAEAGGEPHDLVFFRIFSVGFWVDLTAEQVLLPQIKTELRERFGDEGWSSFPIGAASGARPD